MNKKFLVLSIFIFIAGKFLIILAIKNFTGFVIFDEAKPITAFLGVFLVLISIAVYGLAMMAAPASVIKKRDLEEKVKGTGKKPGISFYRKGEEVYMTDSFGILSGKGEISIRELQKDIPEYDEEIIQEIRDIYSGKLREIISSGNPNEHRSQANYAREFLRLIDKKAAENETETAEDKKEDSILTREKRSEIKSTFRDYRGDRITPQQRAILREHELGIEYSGSQHVKIYSIKHPNHFITTSLTPSSNLAGRKVAADLIRMLEQLKRQS